MAVEEKKKKKLYTCTSTYTAPALDFNDASLRLIVGPIIVIIVK